MSSFSQDNDDFVIINDYSLIETNNQVNDYDTIVDINIIKLNIYHDLQKKNSIKNHFHDSKLFINKSLSLLNIKLYLKIFIQLMKYNYLIGIKFYIKIIIIIHFLK